MSGRSFAAGFALLVFASAGCHGTAPPPSRQSFSPVTTPVIDAVQVSCPVGLEMAVLIVDHSNPFEIAFASRGMVPMITVGDRFFQLRQESQLFVYFHECGHHVLGHVTTPSGLGLDDTGKQLEADCWAARKLDEIGHLVPEVLTGLQGVLDDDRLARIAACAPGSSLASTWGHWPSSY